MSSRSVLLCFVVLSVGAAASVSAQSVANGPAPTTSRARIPAPRSTSKTRLRNGWDADIHFGNGNFHDNSTLTSQALPLGPGFIAANGRNSILVGSFFFGSGTGLVNGIMGQLGFSERLSGIGLQSITRQAKQTYGIRIGHTITSFGYAGFMLDMSQVHYVLSADARARDDAALAAYGPVFQKVLATSLTNVSASATQSIVDNIGQQMALLGDFRITPVHIWRFSPFVTAGGGIMLPRDERAHVTFTGNYQGTASNGVRFAETDTVTVSYSTSASIVKMFGVGFDFMVTRWSGVRVDYRQQMMDAPYTGHLSAAPTRAISDSPAATVVIGGNNGQVLQLSTGSTGQSTLDFALDADTFQNDPHQKLSLITVGYFFRF